MAHEAPCMEEVDGNEAPWSEVNYQKNRKSKGNGVEMTFLVQNLPEQTLKVHLWRAFQPFGFVSDAYVARKKDKRGNNFGFIRYKGVGNVGEFLAKLNTVKIFEAKVTVILAKYDKNHKEFMYTSKTIGEKVWRPKDMGQRDEQCSGMAVPGGAGVKEGRSYASLFRTEGNVSSLGSKTIAVDGNGSKYPLHCRGRSIHGIAKDLATLNNLQRNLNSGGLDNFGLSYVGGLSVLLTLGNPNRVREVLDGFSGVLSEVFSRFSVWNGEDLPVDRVATLRVTGVPVLLKDNSLFDRIGNLFGRVVQGSNFSWQRIDEPVVIQWKERRFVVWVTESIELWSPDSEDGLSLEDSSSDSDNDGDEVPVFDEVEEGEIRPGVPAAGDKVDSRCKKSSDFDKSPSSIPEVSMHQEQVGMYASADVPISEELNADTILDNGGNYFGRKENMEDQKAKDVRDNYLHGDVSMDPRNLDSTHVQTPTFVPVNNLTGGPPSDMDLRDPHHIGPLNSPGPFAPTSIGKRTRDQRSPPSVGSTQGPHIRIRQDSIDSRSSSLDLNRTAEYLYPVDDGATSCPQDRPSGGETRDRPSRARNEVPQHAKSPIADEIEATAAVGEVVGVNLRGFEAETRETIIGEAVDSCGRSGGLVSIWDPTVFSGRDIIKHRFFLCVCGELIPSGKKLNVVNIYAPNDASARRALWSVLVNLRNSRQGLWVFMGDFNDVRQADERLNSEFVVANAEAFNDFILSAALQEYDMGGAKYTYISDRGDKISKLDRFLVCIGFVENWPGAALTALDRLYSDHRPLLLSTNPCDFGHIPFRFYNSWFEMHGFVDFVMIKCNQFAFNGPGDLALATKLRWLKGKIKEWIRVEKRRGEDTYSSHKKTLADLELLAEERNLCVSELALRSDCRNFMLEFDKQRQADTRQKSRIRWACDGDENTSFFHSVVNSNLSSNRINGILVGDEWVSNPVIIKQQFFDFYAQLFSEPMSIRPKIVCPHLNILSTSESEDLIRPFSLFEIKEAVWECDGDRAPGPDGFNFSFLKRCWDGLQNNFIRLFEDFYMQPSLSTRCSSSFIALIPKVKDPMRPSDFRPISLIGCINKVLSKVLVNRLKKVIGKLISMEQSAFLAGRNIVDGPLMLNEVLAWMKQAKRVGGMFKVDIQKAYDSLSWSFLVSILEQMGFPTRWCEWIMALLKSARASVLVNGSPTMEFVCSRGLRQGDPLSPFLFLIAMEALSGMMKKASDVGLFRGISIGNGLTLSHLLYADDVIFLGEWSESNIRNLHRILRCFYMCSGLKVNLSKCSLYGIGVEDHEVARLANFLNCKVGSFPFKYLGLYVGANMNLVRNWKPIVDLFKVRLSIWKAKTLSYGGRITLIKSVLSSLPTYFFSLYRAPTQVLKQLERLRRVFFWGGTEEVSKMAWSAWENVVAPIEYGGLGFGSLRDTNLAMLAKWWWRFMTEKDGLWRKVVWAIHFNSCSWNPIPAKLSISGPWKQISAISSRLSPLGVDLNNSIIGLIRDGEEIAFWLDVWAAPQPLQVLFPSLFLLEKHKWSSVADKFRPGPAGATWIWSWKRDILTPHEVSEFSLLLNIIQPHSVSNDPDSWYWSLDPAGQFSVRSIRKALAAFNQVRPDYVVKWNNWVPKKVVVVAWRAHKERLPTRTALHKRGIPVQNLECVLCREYAETADHLLVSCGFAQTIWQVVCQWCKMEPMIAFSIQDILDAHKFFGGSIKRKKAFHAVCLVTLWNIWISRNELMFEGRAKTVAAIVEEIKAKSFAWVKYRSKEQAMTWEHWKSFVVF
ncbi:putative RNA-directed DNA polymerase [Helianthus anomalus]